jgi:[NiFe] hydrogenase diaphorase moiety large subunit
MQSSPDIEAFTESCLGESPQRSQLLQYLIQIQQAFQFVPATAVEVLAQRLDLSHGEINAVIDFYSFLLHEDPGAWHILFSDNITDRFSGNRAQYERLKEMLAGQSATLDFTSCTGLCDQGPGMLVNGHALKGASIELMEQIATLIKQGRPLQEWPEEWFVINDNIQRRDLQLEQQTVNGEGIRAVLAQGGDTFLGDLEASGLRGRGGAGFATATKWKFCRETAADQRYVVCNADEGEPGTFKDRVLLNSYADSVVEGMTICARVIDASKGFIYLRGEYLYLRDALETCLARRRDAGLLGNSILGQRGYDFDIEIHLGAGAYICGEESALIESLEGKRGHPRIRPPFPVQQGYLGKPTVVNNVETFWSVSNIALQGSDWFRSRGTSQSAGTRLLSISGDCSAPGVYEYPFGTSLADILADCGGSGAQAVQMAGAAGNTVLARDFDRRMSFEDLATGGSFMVIVRQRDLFDVLDNFATFFQHESCGFCTPCRVGSRLICETFEHFREGRGSTPLLDQLTMVTELMKRDSFCGLGTSAPTAFIDALRQSPEIFHSRIDASGNPVFDLDQALGDFTQITGRSTGEET